MSFRDMLVRAAGASGVPLQPRVVDACAAHFALLVRWNRTHNLTRITDPEEAAKRHYLDCLLPLLAWEAPRSFVDVGAGAGFPGLLAALVWPTAKATLVEPAAKRVSFLRLAATAMAVDVEIEPPGNARGDRVLSRATFPPGAREQLAPYAGHEIAVWGHADDLDTWKDEVATWGQRWSGTCRPYALPGFAGRMLLLACDHPLSST